MVVCWLNIFEEFIAQLSCYLAMTDSSSCQGWIYKSNFTTTNQAFHAAVANNLAKIFLEAEVTLYSRHIRGVWNVIVDYLSQDFHLTDNQLISLLKSKFLQQVPKIIHTKPLPFTIIFWINS